MQILKKVFKSEAGATAIEYGLIAALIAVVCIGAMGVIGEKLTVTMETVGASIN
jgi:pilus assembly protein Flp/PilA